MKRASQFVFGLSLLFFCLFLFGITDFGQGLLRGRIPPNATIRERDDIYMGVGLAPWVYALGPSVVLAVVGGALLTAQRIAGSLFLSLLNLLIVAIALAIVYSGLSPWRGAVLFWVVPLPLVVLTVGYVIADAIKSSTRTQALIATAILAPTAAVEWYFRFTGI